MVTETRVFGDVSAGLWRPEFEGTESRNTLNDLLEVNGAAARQRDLYRTDRERLDVSRMARPVSSEKAFATFGLLLGALPPASIFLKMFADVNEFRPEQIWIVARLLLVNSGSAVTGFLSGKVVGRSMMRVSRIHPLNRVFALTMIGLLWGIVAGAAGGIFFFVFGAIVGAVIGGMVGAAALPVFAVLHSLLRRGEMIDKRHLLPLAFGVTLIICAFILGLG